jgi:hypothetical protein
MEVSKKQASVIGISFIVIFVLASALIAYVTPWRDPFSQSFKKLYPAAIVNGQAISIEDADEFVGLARTLDASASDTNAFQTYLNHEKSAVLLKRLGLRLGSDSVSD